MTEALNTQFHRGMTATQLSQDFTVVSRTMPSSRKSTREIGEGEEKCEASDNPQGVLPQNWGGTEQNRNVTCTVLKSTTNDRPHLALCHYELRGP
ncbi:hypothetical protein TNCV_826331 [Trichonephila clavipes]|nr:hypothetical protein TNCV_826331 [Trichonephila clavipes]